MSILNIIYKVNTVLTIILLINNHQVKLLLVCNEYKACGSNVLTCEFIIRMTYQEFIT